MSVRSGGELSTKQLQEMVQALPQYSDQIDKLTLHVEVSSFVLHDMRLQTQQRLFLITVISASVELSVDIL